MNRAIRIAHKVRRICEKIARRKISRSYDFYKEDNLSCMCAIASTCLSRIYDKEGINNIFVVGKFNNRNRHCWVELIDENLIVDITATQFSGHFKKAHMTPTDDDSYDKTNVDKLEDWPETQRPNEQIVSKIMREYLK